MQDKIKTVFNRLLPYLLQLRDIRFAGMVAFGIVVLLISWSGVKVIETNYGLQKQISRLRQENDVQKLENKNLALQNEYYKTDTYLELQARRSFGLASPGETVLIVPKSVALAQITDKEKISSDSLQDSTQQNDTRPFFVKNLESWSDFFLHRQDEDV